MLPLTVVMDGARLSFLTGSAGTKCLHLCDNCSEFPRLKTSVVYISFLLCGGHWPVRDGIYDPKSLEVQVPGM